MSDVIAERLSAPGPKRMLALDGGGTRGIITIQFLGEIERTLQAQLGRQDDFVLSDYYDMIGGTSVGALLATMLALGWRVEQIEETFREWSKVVFQPTEDFFDGKYDARALGRRIRAIIRDESLSSSELKTGLCVVTKRGDTNSVWVMTNNPKSKYFAHRDGRLDNGAYLLHHVLRASTAAPTFFRPKTILIREKSETESRQKGRFIDGAVSPHNNPSLMLLMQASLPQYNLGGGNIHDNEQKTWELGADKLLITSVGAGSHNNPVKPRFLPQLEAIDALLSIMGDNEQLVLSLMQAWSKPLDPWHIDGELGTFADVVMFGEPRFSFQRYELRLDADWLSGKTATREDCGVVPGKHLKYAVDREGLKFHRDLARLQELIDPKQVPRLGRLARAAAKDQVKAGHFPKAFADIWKPASAPRQTAE